MKMQKSKGFTLIELMIVIGIIGVLSAIAIPQYYKYTIRTKNVTSVSAIRPYQIGLAEFAMRNQRLPTTAAVTANPEILGLSGVLEPDTCTGIVQIVSYASAGGAVAGTTATVQARYYDAAEAINAACTTPQIVAEVATMPTELANRTMTFRATMNGNGNLTWQILPADNAAVDAVSAEFWPVIN